MSLLACEVVNWLTMSSAVWLYVLRMLTSTPACRTTNHRAVSTSPTYVSTPLMYVSTPLTYISTCLTYVSRESNMSLMHGCREGSRFALSPGC